MLQLLDSTTATPTAITAPAATVLPRRPAKHACTLAAATPRHIPAITTIYRTQIEDGLGSYEDPLPDAAEMARRLAELQAQGLPAFVALDERRVVRGFTWATPFRFRAHYRHTVEDSIHIHPSARRQGVGEALLRRLIDACAERGYRQMIAVVGDSRNRASIALHEKLGFQPAGYFPAIGRRPGEWCDTVMLQRALGAEGATPAV
jgi:L-amino acid N-acyltransferase YncA